MAVGAGLLAAGAAAGYYFYASEGAAKNRKVVAKWARDLKRDALKQAGKLKKMDRKTIASAIDTAADAYETVRSIDRADLNRAVQELKKNWSALAGEIGSKKTGTGTKRSSSKKSTSKKRRSR